MTGADRRPGQDTTTRALPGRVLLAVALSATVYTIVQGLSYPLLALLLEEAGASPLAIGVNAAMVPVGMVVAGAGAPPLVRTLGARRSGLSSLAVAAACLVAIKVLEHEPLLWMPLRFVMGFALATVFVVTDTWMNELTTDAARGRVIGLYSALLSLGFVLGPGVLVVAGTAGWTPFVVGAGCTLAAIAPLLLVYGRLPDGTRYGGASGWSFLRHAPLLLTGVGVVAFAEQGAMSLLPVWALAHGFASSGASMMLVVMSTGSMVLMLPIGWLADRMSRRVLIAGCSALSGACALLLIVASGSAVLLWPLLFVFGGAYYGIYVLSLVRLGQRFSGQLLVGGTAAFGAFWGLGGIVGPPASGAAMNLLGHSGLPVALATLFAALALAYGLRREGAAVRRRQ